MKKAKSDSKDTAHKLTAEEWETTFDAITDLISIHDRDFRIVKANKAFANAFATIPEKLIGRKCYEIVHGSKEPWPDCPHRKAIMGSTPVKEEFLEPQLGKCLLVSCSPIFSNGSTVKGTVHIVKDVTERRRVEEALQKARDVLEMNVEERTAELVRANEALIAEIAERKKSEEALRLATVYNRSLIEASIDPLVTIDPEGRISDVNAATEAVTGYSREELIGTDFSDYFTDSRKAKMGYRRVFEQGSVRDYALEIHHREGHVTPVLYNASIYRDAAGKTIGVFAAARDITERNKAEEIRLLLSSIVESSEDAIIGKDLDGIIRSWNAGAEKLYGYSEKEAIGRHISIVTPEDRTDEIPRLLEQIKAGEGINHYETARQRKKGRLITVSLSLSPIKDASGKIVGISTIARDTTERKLSEEALRLASVYNRSLIEASLDPLVTIDPEGRISDVNAATEAVTGYSREELIGTDFSDYFTEPEKARHGYRLVFEKGAVRDYPLEIRHREGHVTPVLYNATVYRDETGKTIGVFAAARDITERKLSEEALRLASVYNRSLIEASLDPLVTIDPEGRISDVNAATEAVTGYSREELIGTDFSDYFTEPEKARHGYRLVFEKGAVRDYPLEIRHREGHVTPVLYNATVYRDETGKTIGVFAAARDITERKLSEEALRLASVYNRSLIEASLDPLVTIDPEGRISDVNAATEAVTGYSREELIGTDFSDYFTEPEKARHGYRLVFEKGAVRDYPLEIRHLEGHVTPVLYNATVYRDETGKTIGVFAAARDITEIKKAEREIQRSRDEMEIRVIERTAELSAVNKELESFSYSVSHDLRAPLRAIDGFSKMIMEDALDNLDEDTKRKFERIRKNIRMMSQLIDDLLAFSRLGRAAMNFSKIDMSGLVKHLKSELLAAEGTRHIEVEVDGLPPAYGDLTLIRQVMVNLLMNAIKFTKEREKAVIHVGGYEKGKEDIYYVKDNGIGFDMQYYDKLFGVFQRLHSAREYEGTGVGLANVQRIIKRHGGRVWAEGEVDKGACFYYALPRKE